MCVCVCTRVCVNVRMTRIHTRIHTHAHTVTLESGMQCTLRVFCFPLRCVGDSQPRQCGWRSLLASGRGTAVCAHTAAEVSAPAHTKQRTNKRHHNLLVRTERVCVCVCVCALFTSHSSQSQSSPLLRPTSITSSNSPKNLHKLPARLHPLTSSLTPHSPRPLSPLPHATLLHLWCVWCGLWRVAVEERVVNHCALHL